MVGGNDEDGAMIYVGRAEHEGDMLVCKVVPSKQIGYISQRGEALPKDIFEMLCGEHLKWVKCYDHVIPESAVLCGRTALDQPVYIGRGHYEGHLIIGKISSVHRALFIAYRGAERRMDSYEILVEQPGTPSAGWQLPPPPPPAVAELVEKCPLTPPPPPSPPVGVKPVGGVKPYPYPPDFDAAPFSLHDRPPQYTPMPMPSTDPYPPPPPATPAAVAEPSILPQYRPSVMAAPLPPKPSYMPPPPSYSPAVVATPAVVAPACPASFVPADTYKPPLNHYEQPSCSSYTPAEVAGPSVTHYGAAHDVWVPASPGYTPPDAVYGGHDSDMAPLLVCRAYHAGIHIPGKAAPSRGCAYIAHAGREIVESRYEVLIGQAKYHWVPGYDGSIAAGAVEAGRAHNGEPVFVGRARYMGSLTPGKIQQSHRCLHMAFGGQEVRINSYEVLVRSDFYHRQQACSLSY